MIVQIKKILTENDLVEPSTPVSPKFDHEELDKLYQPTHIQKINAVIQQNGVPFLAGAGTVAGGALLYNKLKNRQR